MEPLFLDGDGVVAIRSNRAAVGQLRVAQHPVETSRWLLKRVAAVNPDDTMHLLSDSPDHSAVDSRQFGNVNIQGSYRVVLHFRTTSSGRGIRIRFLLRPYSRHYE